MNLFYNDGGDTIYVMDQVGDSNTDGDWIDEIMIKDEIKNLDPREKTYFILDLCRAKHRWKLQKKSV